MYDRKTVEPKMELAETLLLPERSFEDFPSRTTLGHSFLGKDKIKPNTRPEIL